MVRYNVSQLNSDTVLLINYLRTVLLHKSQRTHTHIVLLFISVQPWVENLTVDLPFQWKNEHKGPLGKQLTMTHVFVSCWATTSRGCCKYYRSKGGSWAYL